MTTAIARPPPLGVGTLWDDREFGAVTSARRDESRSNIIVIINEPRKLDNTNARLSIKSHLRLTIIGNSPSRGNARAVVTHFETT